MTGKSYGKKITKKTIESHAIITYPYLNTCSTTIQIENGQSLYTIRKCKKGLAWGSKLSPILFNIMIDDFITVTTVKKLSGAKTLCTPKTL